MSGGKRPSGYTIVEVLIVLAVSGVMFVIAANFINGKQAKTSFNQGINEMASRLQDTVGEVMDGQYSDVPLNCSFGGGVTNPNLAVPVPDKECVFLGKMLHFSLAGDAKKYQVLSLAGGRVDSTGKPITCLKATPPNCPTGAAPAFVDVLTVDQNVPHSMQITKISVKDDSGADRGQSFIVGFIQGQGTLSAANSLTNGAQSISLYFVDGATSNQDESAAKAQLTNNLVRASTIQMCITDGERYAVLRMGAENGQFNVGVKNYGVTKPALC